MLTFKLLGQPVLAQNGEPLTQFRSQKEAALLIYLAQTGQSHSREFLAELLWESSTTKQSLTNLRTLLSRLRKQVDEALLVTRQTVALTPENLRQVDAVNLLQTLTAVTQVETLETAVTLQNALDAYQGEFLADFHLANAPRFEEWMLATRAHIHRQVIAAYDKLRHYALAAGDTAFGLALARRWLQVDALDETAHTLLIQLLIEVGNVREAVTHYGNCATLLRTELGVEPPAAMTALIKAAQPKRPVGVGLVTAVRHNLPTDHDQFFGRKTDQDEIHTRLDQPWCRLVTIVGQGGMGKTRLATTIARSRLSQYRDGVWLVRLDGISPDDEDLAEAIAVEIATILDLRLSGSDTPVAQLLHHLQHKQMLLVLDNLEHLLDGIQTILDIVQGCDQVQLLVTSREVLGLRAEWTIALTGLNFPTSDEDEMSSDAVELFAARRAQQQRGDIAAADLTAIRHICRMVEGLPLAIELAAALTRHATARAVAASLRDGFDALAATQRDVPQRHRGLDVVFEMSWRTLTPVLQQRLASLSVFRGGFTAAAAQQVAAADEWHLAGLVDKSLLAHDGEAGRYVLHAVVRAYAAAKRPSADPTLAKHADYYLTWLAQYDEPLQKSAPQQATAVIQPDMDNVRLAWQTGLAEGQADLLLAALTPLSVYYQLYGLAHEAEAVMHTTVSTASAWGANGTALTIRAGLERARFQNRLGRHRPAIQSVKKALKLAISNSDGWAEGMGQVLWSEALWRLGEYDMAESKLTQALHVAQAIASTLLRGWCHHHLGIINDIQSRYDVAYEHLEKACACWREIDNSQALSGSLNSIGVVCYHRGDLPAAQRALEQALAVSQQLDDRHRQSTLLNNLSLLSTEQGDFMGAQYYLQLGLELATASGDLYSQGLTYINLGRNISFQDVDGSGVAYLEKGRTIMEAIGERSKVAEATITMAEIKQKQGDLKQAESLYDQALTIARQNGWQRTECAALIGMAELLSAVDREQARQCSANAVVLAEAIQNPQLLERANTIDRYLSVSV